MSRVVVTGATGLIGRALSGALVQRGEEVVVLSRDPERARAALGGVTAHGWRDPLQDRPPLEALGGADAVVHLAGEPVAQRWSAPAKQRIRDSRVLSTRHLVQALREMPAAARPRTLVCQSATGYYGPAGDRRLDEAAPAGADFLAEVVGAWEAEARAAEPELQVVSPRTGVVLSPSGGALGRMLPFFRAGLGGPVAGGRQYVPWVHLDDVVGAILFCLDQAGPAGPVNVVAPHPVTNAELSAALGRTLHRPALLPVPALALRTLYGEMSTIVTTGQRAVPRRLLEHGFRFSHPELDEALKNVLGTGD